MTRQEVGELVEGNAGITLSHRRNQPSPGQKDHVHWQVRVAIGRGVDARNPLLVQTLPDIFQHLSWDPVVPHGLMVLQEPGCGLVKAFSIFPEMILHRELACFFEVPLSQELQDIWRFPEEFWIYHNPHQ